MLLDDFMKSMHVPIIIKASNGMQNMQRNECKNRRKMSQSKWIFDSIIAFSCNASMQSDRKMKFHRHSSHDDSIVCFIWKTKREWHDEKGRWDQTHTHAHQIHIQCELFDRLIDIIFSQWTQKKFVEMFAVTRKILLLSQLYFIMAKIFPRKSIKSHSFPRIEKKHKVFLYACCTQSHNFESETKIER